LASRESPRRRIILPLQRSTTEAVQRMLNFMQPGSYARPHCHPLPENVEHVVVIRGAIGFLIFDSAGDVLAAHRLSAGNPAACLIDIEPGVWHTLVPLEEDTVVMEAKRGPYNSATDKQFATWAPEEGAPSTADYSLKLESLFK
jgi:cupin fold WbuC family metalloprotein